VSKLKYLRIKSGMTLEELSVKTSLTIGHLSHLENGSRNPSKETMETLAEALGETVPEVFYTELTVPEAQELANKGHSVPCNDGIATIEMEESEV